MIECTRRLKFDAGHRVHLHESKCRNAHGHQYIVYIHATSEYLDNL
jgi:6-pyruvoyltetrahydropterin/6-carboxytetrahydropterin synthase